MPDILDLTADASGMARGGDDCEVQQALGLDAQAPQTAEEAADVVRRSRLVVPGALAACMVNSGDAPRPRGAGELLARLVEGGLLTEFQATSLARGVWRGLILGEYRLLRPLTGGEGSRGMFLAHHAGLRRQAVIKVLQFGRVTDVTTRRFLREARALAALDHPNIIRGYDVDRDGDLLYLATEYVEGEDLLQIVSRGPLPVALAADIVRQAALGLAHAHAAGWAHRDVKPANLLLSRRDCVKVLDLGLARLCEEDEEVRLTCTQAGLLGSADYLAPEQSLDSHQVDGRADIYSLGATFYHLLTGRPPYQGGTTVQKVARHHASRPVPVRSLRPEVPACLESVVERMMARTPEGRYQSAAEVAEELSSWQREELRGGPKAPLTPTSRRGFEGARVLSALVAPVAALFRLLARVAGRRAL